MQDVSTVSTQKFWANVEPFSALDACWQWVGKLDRYGYGAFRQGARSSATHWIAHRLAYTLLVGEIPEGMVIDHLCRNRACVNPDHLEPVTSAENTRRGFPGVRRLGPMGHTHCSHGHEMTPDNTMTTKAGYRRCRTCNRLRLRRFHQENPGKRAEYRRRFHERNRPGGSGAPTPKEAR